jgi:hypothetical protein
MASPADIQETAQALFCALAESVGSSNIKNIFNKQKYPTYFDFKKFWDEKYTINTVEKTFKNKVSAGKASFKQVEDLLYGVNEKSKRAKNDWYYSSLEIAAQLLKDITTISKNFSYLKTGHLSDIFYAQGDKEVMDNMAALFKRANDYLKEQNTNNKHGAKLARPFDNINKWTTADIYFASTKAKKLIEDYKKEKDIDFLKLNSFVSRMIADGELLPLSLKKQVNKVTIKKVNFNRPQEQKEIDKLEYGGTSDWKIYDKDKDIKDYTRTLLIYMSKDKSLYVQIRHDPSGESYKGVVQFEGAGAFEGSLAMGPMSDIVKNIDSRFYERWTKTFEKANQKFKNEKKYLDKELKEKDRKQYENKREIASAELTNEVNPLLIDWLKKDKTKANQFVRGLYTYATARSNNSAKYVIAK